MIYTFFRAQNHFDIIMSEYKDQLSIKTTCFRVVFWVCLISKSSLYYVYIPLSHNDSETKVCNSIVSAFAYTWMI